MHYKLYEMTVPLSQYFFGSRFLVELEVVRCWLHLSCPSHTPQATALMLLCQRRSCQGT